MRIITLVENTAITTDLKSKHGLCIYIETPKHKLLFDLGPDDTYLHNAKKLGVDLSEVDTVVLSHGHSDHGGALSGFLQFNQKAKFYLHRQAFEPHYIKILLANIYIGLDKNLVGNKRFILTGDVMEIDDELFLFSDVDGHFETESNRALLKKSEGRFIQDDFSHEQNLIITTEGKSVLFSGCSHRGINNILKTAKKHRTAIKKVFGGFHLYNPTTKAAEPTDSIQKLAEELLSHEIVFYTGHCTGEKAYEMMRRIMGDKIQYISTGFDVTLHN